MFPLGELPKAEVRALAREFGLAVAEKADSQDICFVPKGRYTDIIHKLKPDAAEPARSSTSMVAFLQACGHHQLHDRPAPGPWHRALEPLFVVRLDPSRRQVIVGPREALQAHTISLRNVNWLGDDAIPDDGLDVWVRVRSTGGLLPGRVRPAGDGKAQVALSVGEYGVSAGQACVFYADESPRARILGGGFIVRADARGAGVTASRPAA